jgi:RNA polymerase sigma-70 factor (ECF subfamily)
MMRLGADSSHVRATQFGSTASTLLRVETEIELLGRLRSGDEQAFAILVERYQIPMLRLANSMVSNRAVAEEAVQDTWMGVVRGIELFEGRSSLKTWLFHILVNRVRTARAVEEKRRVDRVPSVDPARFNRTGQWAQPVQPWDEDVEERLDASAFMPTLRAALDLLPARQRDVVLLRDVEGLSSDETCDVLGIRPGNQRILLHRGRAGLRNRLAAEMGMA